MTRSLLFFKQIYIVNVYIQTMKTLTSKIFIVLIFLSKTYFRFFFAACKVLYNKETIVIGPTPPGTGVIFEAFL